MILPHPPPLPGGQRLRQKRLRQFHRPRFDRLGAGERLAVFGQTPARHRAYLPPLPHQLPHPRQLPRQAHAR